MEPKSRFGSWPSDAQLAEGGTLLAVLTVMRVIALIIVISMTFAIVLTHSPPILAKPTLFGIGLAHLVDLMASGCGPGWHWSNRRGWNWGHCVLDWRPIWQRPAPASRLF